MTHCEGDEFHVCATVCVCVCVLPHVISNVFSGITAATGFTGKQPNIRIVHLLTLKEHNMQA